MSRSMQQPLSVTLARKLIVLTSSGVINLSLHGTLLLKAALGEHMANTGLRSAVLTVASFATGLGPDARAAQVGLKVLVELIVEALFVYHQQMTGVASLPFIAIVHALRQSMWMCIVVWALDGDARQQLKLGACNWTFLVLVSCCFQRYTWAAYRQHSSTQQRLTRPPPLTTVLEGVPGFVSETTSPAEPLSQGASSSALNRSNTIPYSTQQSGWESEAAALEMETCSPHPSAPGTPTVTSIGDLLGHYGNTKQGKEWVAAMQRFSDDGAGSDAKHSAQSLYGQAHMHLQPPPSLRQPSGSSAATGSRQGKGHQSQSSTVTATSSNRSSTELGIRFGDAAGQQKPPEVPVETAMDSNVPAGNRALDISVIQSITPVISSEDSDQMTPAAEAARRAVDGPAAADQAEDGPVEAGRDSPFQQQSEEAMSDVGTELPPVGPTTPGADVTGAAAAEAADQAAGSQPAASRNAPAEPTAPAGTPAQEQPADTHAPAQTTREMPLHTQQDVEEAGGDVAIDAAITRRLPSVPYQLEALIRRIDDRRRRPYMRKSDRESKAVHVKINGIELEQLPADLSGMLHEQLRNGMPGVMMTSMALRSGCVIIALDLLSSPEDGEAAGGSGMADLMSRIMQGHNMGKALEDGATMSIQMPDEITACQWDTDSNGYWVVDEEEGALDPSSLKAYHTISTLPTVISLPETGDDNNTCRELVFTVELQLPGNCHLYGWQPAGVPAPAESDVVLQAVPQARAVVDAMLLARRLDGGYLPVVVERIVREDTDGSDASQHTTARLVVTVDDVAPAALCLELWCQGQGTGPPAPDGRIEPGHELLVSHMPLLVLPSSWKEAAEELQQHIVETGGVQPRNALPPHARDATRQARSEGQSGCLLEDLGMWLTHPDRVAGTVLSDSAMARLGDDLLVHAVQHGLGAVASMIVDHMPRIEQQGSGNDASPWLRRVSGSGGCGDGDGMNLLHAAMASGSADILGQLFRWGARFGGPGWSWSWELEASEGLTALHFTASQPEDICRGMLETITRMLPAAQVHAARNAWLHCQGGVSTTPAELWGMAAHGDGVSFMWATDALEVSSGSLVSKPSSELYNNSTRLAEVATPSSTSSGKRSKEPSGSSIGCEPAASGLSITRSPSAAAAVTSLRAKVQSLLGSVVEVWVTPETEEYRTWASKQTFKLIHWWVVPLLALSALGMYRSASEGCVQYELMHLGLHALAYLPIMASARGLSWLGDWQAWMLVTHTLDALGYGAKTFLCVHQASVWAAASSSAVNVCCVVLISAALNQAPRPHLLVACMFMAYFRSLAYQMVGHPHPLRHALVTDAIALGISTLARARQLRAFQAWLADLLDRRNGPRPTATVPSARTKPPYGMAAVRQASGGF